MRGQRDAPAAPYPRERPGTHCAGCWVGPKAGLDSYHITTQAYIHNNILTDQYNGFVTLKDFELPDDGFD